jgi:hypothetical protein
MIEYWNNFRYTGEFWDPMEMKFHQGEINYDPINGIFIYLNEKLKMFNNHS